MEAGGGGGGGRDVSHQAATAEEEEVKRNTDCVYFLASPLTCKKGSECEYRHSEGARVNPRDCWYWLNGNCLNPKCSFRHPPLDSLYGSPGTTSGPVAPVSHTVSSMQMPATHASAHKLNKQNVPCYYFQKGGCIKGDRCPFMHGPQTSANPGPTTSSVPRLVAKPPASLTVQSQSLKKDSWGPKECTTQQPKINVEKPIKEQPSTTKPAIMAEASSDNGSLHKKSSLPYILDNELRKSQPPHVSLKSNDVQSVPHGCQLQPTEEHFQSGREADEFLAESSPGFDVLVDVNGEDPDYFHSEDDYGRASVQAGRTQNPMNDFDYHHADYEHTLQFERDTYNGMDEYEQDGRAHSRHGWEQRRRSSERILDRQLMHDKRALGKEEIPNEVDGLDLRHRLLKLRRLNGQRSAVSPDRPRQSYRRVDRCIEDRDRSHNLGRDEQEYPPESTISSRLQGRITLPRRSSPDAVVELRSKKERDMGRHRGRLFLAPPISNCPGMQFDRIRWKADEEFSTDLRNSGYRPNIIDDVEFMDFAGPKSLAELKGEKIVGSSQNQQTNKQRSMKPGKGVGHQESEGSLTFESPKPLSMILKRKRETTHGNSAMSSSGDENLTKGTDGTSSSVSAAATNMCLAHSSEAGRQWNNEVEEEEEEEGLICAGGEELHDDGHSTAKNELEVEDGMIMEAVDDHDLENHEQREESDYEVTEGGDFRTEDDENIHEDDEELDDEDDFARKVGMILS